MVHRLRSQPNWFSYYLQAEDISTAEIVAAFKEAGASQGLLDAISKLKSPQKKAANRAQLAVMGAGLGATDADKLIFPQAAAKLGIPN